MTYNFQFLRQEQKKMMMMLMLALLSRSLCLTDTYNETTFSTGITDQVLNYLVSENRNTLVVGTNQSDIYVFFQDGDSFTQIGVYNSVLFVDVMNMKVSSNGSLLFSATDQGMCILELTNAGISQKLLYVYGINMLTTMAPDFQTILVQAKWTDDTFTFFNYNGVSHSERETTPYTTIADGANILHISFSDSPIKILYLTDQVPSKLRVMQNQYNNAGVQQFSISHTLTHSQLTQNSKIFHNSDMSIIGFCQADTIIIYKMSNSNYIQQTPFIPQPGQTINDCAIVDNQIKVEYLGSLVTLGVYRYDTNTPYSLISSMQMTTNFDSFRSFGERYMFFDISSSSLTIKTRCPVNCDACDQLGTCTSYALTPIIKVDPCLKYMQSPNDHICQILCSRQCSSCIEEPENCLQCQSPFTMDQQGQCTLPAYLQNVGTLASTLNMVRSPKLKILFFIIGQLELYEYHNIEYNGMVKMVFESSQQMEDRIWNIFPFLEQWSKSLFVFLPNYNAYTPRQSLQNSRRNSLLLDNTQSFFTVYVPTIIIVFLICNKLFYCLFNYPLSSIFRCFSFKLFLMDLLFLNQLPTLWFLAMRNMLTLFSPFFSFKIVQALMVMFLFVLICLIAIFFFYEYNYGKLVFYFLPNMKRKKRYLKAVFLIYILKPIVLSSIHLFCIEKPALQLQLLCVTYLCNFMAMGYFQVRWKLFKNKTIFSMECLISLLMSIMNCFLILRYCLGRNSNEYNRIVDLGINGCILMGGLCMLVVVGIALALIVKDLIKVIKQSLLDNKKQTKQDQKGDGKVIFEGDSMNNQAENEQKRGKNQIRVP